MRIKWGMLVPVVISARAFTWCSVPEKGGNK